MLPADEERRFIVAAPDDKHLLRYGDGRDGQIWRLDASGWVQDDTLAGELNGAVWTDDGILVTYADGSADVIDPASGRRQAGPAGATVSGSTLPAAGLLLAMRGAAVELWQLGDEQPSVAWPAPQGRNMRLDDVSEGAAGVMLQATRCLSIAIARLASSMCCAWMLSHARSTRCGVRNKHMSTAHRLA